MMAEGQIQRALSVLGDDEEIVLFEGLDQDVQIDGIVIHDQNDRFIGLHRKAPYLGRCSRTGKGGSFPKRSEQLHSHNCPHAFSGCGVRDIRPHCKSPAGAQGNADAPGRGLEEGLVQIIIIGAQFGDVECGFGGNGRGAARGFRFLVGRHSFAAASRTSPRASSSSGSSAASGLPWERGQGGIGVALVQLRLRFQFQRARHIPQMQRSQIGRSPLEGVRPFAEGFPVMGADGMAEEGGASLRVGFWRNFAGWWGIAAATGLSGSRFRARSRGAETPMMPHRARKAAPDLRPALPEPGSTRGAGYGWCRRAAPV